MLRPGLGSGGIGALSKADTKADGSKADGTSIKADDTGIIAGVAVAESPARTPVRPAEPEPEPERETDRGAAGDAGRDAGTEGETEGDGINSFDTEFALLQLEWPQPVGAIRSEGELAPPPPQLQLTPRRRDRQRGAMGLRG